MRASAPTKALKGAHFAQFSPHRPVSAAEAFENAHLAHFLPRREWAVRQTAAKIGGSVKMGVVRSFDPA
jgi:hypothetical protein